MIIWLTGLPCSGKTTLAKGLIERLGNCDLLDGDELRDSDFARGVGYTPEQRERHLLRVGWLAQHVKLWVDYVICAFVSPSETARQKLPIDLLVYVKCSAEECARRDVKGMWAKAFSGELRGFTGYDAPYDEPVSPDVVVDTERTTIDQCVKTILAAVRAKAAT